MKDSSAPQVKHPITTKTGQSQKSTFHTSGDGAGKWLRKHRDAMDDPFFLVGMELCTEWTVATPSTPPPLCSTRKNGESDAEFKDRHIKEVANDMVNHPPVP